MSLGARSLAAWAGYVLILGVVLLLFPNVILSLFQIEETSLNGSSQPGSTMRFSRSRDQPPISASLCAA